MFARAGARGGDTSRAWTRTSARRCWPAGATRWAEPAARNLCGRGEVERSDEPAGFNARAGLRGPSAEGVLRQVSRARTCARARLDLRARAPVGLAVRIHAAAR